MALKGTWEPRASRGMVPGEDTNSEEQTNMVAFPRVIEIVHS